MAKVLIVLDGGYRFSETGMGGTPDFTYIALVDALTAAGHQLSKAHRQSDTSASPMLQNFHFDAHDLLQYDVMWLIGLDGRNVSGTSIALPEPELAAIARFMEAGGGVFATGDHDSIGSNMCGHILRVRAMRCWYGQGDSISPMDPTFPTNFPPTSALRADTTRRNPAGSYAGGPPDYVWFENQSDSVPQPITHLLPTHPILKRPDGTAITVYPDHMHEGNTLGVVMGFPYPTSEPDYDGTTFVEFPEVDGNREMPRIIATGQSVPYASRYANSNSPLDDFIPDDKTINTLSVYDGRAVGVGRIVTGATFHHYVDINLTGDSRIDTPAEFGRTGPDAAKTHGFNDAPATFADIRQVFANITAWLARPRPKIQIVLERSTFSEAEATANPDFAGAIRVYVDGLKPGQFPGGGIDSLLPADFDLAWAPALTPLEPDGLSIVATGVDSDDPGLHDRLQRITFTYRVRAEAPAFTFMGNFNHVQLDAALTSAAVSAPLTDSAQITLVKAANPFMLDLDHPDAQPWLSSDVRVFRAIAGQSTLGKTLAAGANRSQALAYLRAVVGDMTVAQFENDLEVTQSGSTLSSLPTTTAMPIRNIYNFAIARVRVPATGTPADDVRVFFRIFRSQTTAALTYNESPPGTPIEGYKRTAVGIPIALPGTNGAGTQWLSFPMFSAERDADPNLQTDIDNLKDGLAAGSSTFYGALIDTNLDDDYLPSVPGPGAPIDLRDMLMGEHQCIVAQIEYAGTPIPNGANPFTSDKLAQRNLALSPIANPGLDASRTALHTFEIEATPNAIGGDWLPDELLLDWDGEPPEGTEVRLYISSWDAQAVVDLADRFYPRHEIRAIDAHTVALPGGGVRYVPIPTSHQRQTGIVVAGFPLGVRKGRRYDLAVRQVTTRGRRIDPPPPKLTNVSREEAARLVAELEVPQPAGRAGATVPQPGVFDLGGNRILVTDLRVLDAQGDHAVIVENPEPEAVESARRLSGRWRETIGAFQLGIPVSDKAGMLAHHVRLLSMFRWRAQFLRPNGHWYETFHRYVDLIADKVRALGGDPWSVPATPDGDVPRPGGDGDVDPEGTGDAGKHDDFWRRCCPAWLAWLILLLLLILLVVLLTR